ncbi:alpha/beta fold hydrolase [Smaragdicoccus niigatensis]|uniref:alpha/beta fold hydrolase n=1 Tax=Smaragdicoccus niigatensis TaxID=359359 RepID=UPI00036C4B4B|nr:alpha/beta hydrolase [Smaragdicoccus niigatensis]
MLKLKDDPNFALYSSPPRGRVVDVRSADGTRLHTEVFGPEDGYPIVLSHGICCSTLFWAHQITALSTQFRVIAFDHRGHGRSEIPRTSRMITSALGDDIEAVLRATLRHGEKAVIAGHSMGGIALYTWANRYPRSVARSADALALINTTPGDIIREVDVIQLPEVLASPRATLARGATWLLGGVPVPARFPLSMQAVGYLALDQHAGRAERALLQELVLSTSPRTRGAFVRVLPAIRYDRFYAGNLTAPTLVIGSTNDRLIPIVNSRRIEALLPNSLGLVELPGGHCAPIECPEAVTAQLRDLTEAGARQSTA